MTANSLYEDLVNATAIYLGPAADRFITRQIINHLGKAPEKLRRDDLRELVKWIKPAMALLTEDIDMVDHYIDSINKLIVSPRRVD